MLEARGVDVRKKGFRMRMRKEKKASRHSKVSYINSCEGCLRPSL